MAIVSTEVQVKTYTAGENLSARDYVFEAHPDAPYTLIDGIVPGRVYKADGTKRHCSVNAQLVGFVVADATAGNPVRVRRSGNMAGFSGLVAGAHYQPSATAGGIERLENHCAALPNPVATAISTTELLVRSQNWAVRGMSYYHNATILYRHNFTNDNVLNMTPLTGIPGYSPSCAASATKLYIGGGKVDYTVNYLSVLFSTELASAVLGSLTVGRNYTCGAASSTKFYCESGYTGANSNVIDSVVMAVDGNFSDVGDLTATKRHTAATSGNITSRVLGGYTSAAIANVDKLLYATDVVSAGSDLPAIRCYEAALVSRVNSYAVGGQNGGNLASIASVIHSTDVTSTLAAVLSQARTAISGNSSVLRGAVNGGGSFVNHDSFWFATETVSAMPNLGGTIASPAGAAS